MSHKIYARLDQLSAKLERLTPQQRIHFALDCAEHVFFFFEQWAQTEGVDSAGKLRAALTSVKSHLDENGNSVEEVTLLIEIISDAIPNTDDSNSISPSGGMDSGIAGLCALRCIIEPSVQNALAAGEHAMVAYDITSYDPAVLNLATPQDYMNSDFAKEAIAEWERQLNLVDQLLSDK